MTYSPIQLGKMSNFTLVIFPIIYLFIETRRNQNSIFGVILTYPDFCFRKMRSFTGQFVKVFKERALKKKNEIPLSDM